MKNVKNKLGLFSLLAILAVSVFLTACEQDNIEPEILEEVSIENSVIFTLPDEINNLSDEKITEYLHSLSDEEIAKLSIEAESGELESECGWKRHDWKRHDWKRHDWKRHDWKRHDWKVNDWKRHSWKALHIECKLTKSGCESADYQREYIYEKCGKNYRMILGDCCYR